MKNNAQDNRALLDTLMQRLSADDKKKLQNILSDESACEKILNSPEARKLMRDLGGK